MTNEKEKTQEQHYYIISQTGCESNITMSKMLETGINIQAVKQKKKKNYDQLFLD